MKAGFVVLIVLGAITVTAGGVLLGVGIAQGAFNNKLITKEYEVTDSFTNFDVNLTVSDITFKKAEDDKCKVVSYEKERLFHKVEVSENTLKVTCEDNLRFYEKIFGYNGIRAEVYLPLTVYESFKIRCSTGNVRIESGFTFSSIDVETSTGGISFKTTVDTGDAKLKASTGKINVDGFTCNTLTVGTSTGDISIKNAEVANANFSASTGQVRLEEFNDAGKLNITTSTGDVTFKNIDALDEIKIHTSTGDVRGNFLTGKSFSTKTTTGHVNVPSTTGTRCEIETSTGDINIEVKHA